MSARIRFMSPPLELEGADGNHDTLNRTRVNNLFSPSSWRLRSNAADASRTWFQVGIGNLLPETFRDMADDKHKKDKKSVQVEDIPEGYQ